MVNSYKSALQETQKTLQTNNTINRPQLPFAKPEVQPELEKEIDNIIKKESNLPAYGNVLGSTSETRGFIPSLEIQNTLKEMQKGLSELKMKAEKDHIVLEQHKNLLNTYNKPQQKDSTSSPTTGGSISEQKTKPTKD